MSLGQWSTALRRAWPLVAVLTALGVAAAGLYLARAVPQYTAQTTVFFSFARGGTASELNQGTTFTQGLVKTFAEVVTTEQVLLPVIEREDLDVSAAQLARRVEALQPEDTLLLQIAVTDPAPETAARTADAIADQLNRSVADLVPSSGTSAATATAETISVTELARAEVPTSPSSPRSTPLVLGVGVLLGLLGGLALVTLAALFDDRIRTARALRLATGAPVLGELTPRAKGVFSQGRPDAVEPVRRMRAHVATVLHRTQVNTVLLTSAGRGDGRTSTAIALAEAFAEAGSSVVLVEADLRQPCLARRLVLDAGPGLSEVLGGTAPLTTALQPGRVEGLSVVVAGAAPADPAPLLASSALPQLLRELSARFDVVLVDAPDLTTTADAITLGKHAPGVLVVARHGRSRVPQVERACEALSLAGVPVLGAVLDRAGRVRQSVHLRHDPARTPAAVGPEGRDQDGEWLLGGPDADPAGTAPFSNRR